MKKGASLCIVIGTIRYLAAVFAGVEAEGANASRSSLTGVFSRALTWRTNFVGIDPPVSNFTSIRFKKYHL